jgi:hypothetical protein
MPLLSYAYLIAVILSGIYLFFVLVPGTIDKFIAAVKGDSPTLWKNTKNMIVMTIILIIVWTLNAVVARMMIIP